MLLVERLLALHPGASRRTLKQWLAGGRVRLNGTIARRGDVPVGDGDRIELGPPPPAPLPGGLRLLVENPRLLAVDKPAGLLTIATERERQRTAYRLLRDHLAAQRGPRRPGQPLFIVHRLDRETSGVLVFAKTPAAKHALQAQFEARTVERLYVALVEGRMPGDAGTLRGRLTDDGGVRVRLARGDEGREAVTHWRVLAHARDTTRLELRIDTGRRGQIRAQLAAAGHPIAGDAAYGARSDPHRRLCLHAMRLTLDDDGSPLAIESAAPF